MTRRLWLILDAVSVSSTAMDFARNIRGLIEGLSWNLPGDTDKNAKDLSVWYSGQDGSRRLSKISVEPHRCTDVLR